MWDSDRQNSLSPELFCIILFSFNIVYVFLYKLKLNKRLLEIKHFGCAYIKHVKDINKRDKEKINKGGVKNMTKIY